MAQGMSHPALTDTVLRRLRRGPASAMSLAGWCDLRTPFMRRMLDGMVRDGTIRRHVTLYALPTNPLSPAAPITIGRRMRWARPVWDAVQIMRMGLR